LKRAVECFYPSGDYLNHIDNRGGLLGTESLREAMEKKKERQLGGEKGARGRGLRENVNPEQ